MFYGNVGSDGDYNIGGARMVVVVLADWREVPVEWGSTLMDETAVTAL